MALKLSPEYWISGLVKSATNGKKISVRLRRILTLIIIPLWIMGIAISVEGFIKAKEATHKYKHFKSRLESLNMMYPNDNGRFDGTRSDYMASMNEAERNTGGYCYWIYFLLLCLIIPWVVARLVFWIIDAKEVGQVSEPK